MLVTTHSPHIASVAPLESILLLKDHGKKGTVGSSTASMDLSDDEAEDLGRYLDVTRAEMLFARGVILVEGDAERFLVPVFAEWMNVSLDKLGITVCSVAGTNFQPYAKFLTALGIPFAVATDWDPREKGAPLGYNRALGLVKTIKAGKGNAELMKELKAIEDMNVFSARCESYGVFTNIDTLELDLLKEEDFPELMFATLREGDFGKERMALIDAWEKDPAALDKHKFIGMIEDMGKGHLLSVWRRALESSSLLPT